MTASTSFKSPFAPPIIHSDAVVKALEAEIARLEFDKTRINQTLQGALITLSDLRDIMCLETPGRSVIEAVKELVADRGTQIKENAALLAANRDCILHFDTLMFDYKNQATEIEKLRNALQHVHNDGATWSAQTYIREVLRITK